MSAWFSALFFAGARFSNYDAWLLSPGKITANAQIVYSGSSLLSDTFNGAGGQASFKGLSISSGVYSAWFSAGILTTSQLLTLALGGLILSIFWVLAGIWHNHRVSLTDSVFSYAGAILKHHIGIVLGLGSISWSGHLVHYPREMGVSQGVTSTQSLVSIGNTNWIHLRELLTFSGVIDPVSGNLPVTDVIHHHLAVG